MSMHSDSLEPASCPVTAWVRADPKPLLQGGVSARIKATVCVYTKEEARSAVVCPVVVFTYRGSCDLQSQISRFHDI